MSSEPIDALVVGGGPAGLMAATALANAGRQVVVTEAKSSIGRKFLMAGKSGLNLTKDEPLDRFLPHFYEAASRLRVSLEDFDPRMVQDWAKGLGQEIFVGTSGRVFPSAMKASPLLRAWLRQLTEKDVEFRTGWRWLCWSEDRWIFDTPQGRKAIVPKVAVLALGGASWPRLGSDGEWFETLRKAGVSVEPFQAANAAIAVNWSPHMSRFFGTPVKGAALRAGSETERGEFVVSAQGLEGGGIYAISRQVRLGFSLSLDLVPDLTLQQVQQRLASQKSKDTIANQLRKALNLSPIKLALLMEFGRPLPTGEGLAKLVKFLPIQQSGLRPLAEAISTAGGVSWDAVDDTLMLKAKPGVFVAGEMIDWEAPTGGYLLTACLATGLRAGNSAARWNPD